MAKSTATISAYQDPHQDLFAKIEDRKRRRLFLPKLLEDQTRNRQLQTPARDAGYQVILNWWDQAQRGRLNRKETSIDAAFLSEVFGQALGYRGVTESSEHFELERQFHVPGVGQCDGALGLYPPTKPENVRAVIELKDASVHLDRDKFNGRTPVQQVWDYLNAMPETCIWGIVSNFTTIRLYHRAKGSQVYEQFRLREMAEDRRAYDHFYTIFERGGLLKGPINELPRAVQLLESSDKRQQIVGDELYENYSKYRLSLIDHLYRDKGYELETAIRIAQKLIDRILFVAFCEDRQIIPQNTIDLVVRSAPPFAKARNPIWQHFLGLFEQMDKGGRGIGNDNGYNGGLFREDELIDRLDLDDSWTTFFHNISKYDFAHEVNVDVLGHLFEKSITELERLREGALYAKNRAVVNAPMMPKSPQRKLFGVYYTPVEFTTAITAYTIDDVVADRFQAVRDALGITDAILADDKKKPVREKYWRQCLAALKTITVCDPACGSGAFLIQAYECLFQHYALVITELEHLGVTDVDNLFDDIPDTILARNIYGVDLQAEAVEIAQLSLWLRTARMGKTLSDLSRNIICGNSLTDDPAVHPRAMKWEQMFPHIFHGDAPGFDCIIGNPPWERIKLQEREFFALSAPEIAAATNAAIRRRAIEELKTENPELHESYLDALAETDRMLAYARASGRYPLTGKGDINFYVLFAELASQIVAPHGRVGLLVPSGIATDKTTAKFFNMLTSRKRLRRLFDFENRMGIFADVHRSFKFSILNYCGKEATSESVDFVFFAHSLDDLADAKRHIALTAADMKLLNPNTKTCPVFRDRRDAELTKGIYQRVPVLIDRNRKEGGNPWGVKFVRMFDQTNSAELFETAGELKKKRFTLDGNIWRKGAQAYLPLYEAKMIQAYDHRAASVEVVQGNWMRQGQTIEPTLVEYQNPEHVAMPRWWVNDSEVRNVLKADPPPAFMGFKDITSPTNQRTMIASWIPYSAVTNHFVLALSDAAPRRQCCLLANFNSMVFDFAARQKIGGVTLNFFIVEQLPTFPPDVYDDPCPWDSSQTLERWISDRVLRLSCTANDMKPLAEACGLNPPVHKWKPAERETLLAELDAAYFHLYGISREELIYILTTFPKTRAKQSVKLFEPNPQTMLSEAGQRIVGEYDRII